MTPLIFDFFFDLDPSHYNASKIPSILDITHNDKPATHCPCLQTGVGAEHSLLLLQPE